MDLLFGTDVCGRIGEGEPGCDAGSRNEGGSGRKRRGLRYSGVCARQEKPSDRATQLMAKALDGKVVTVDSLTPSDLIGHVKAKVLCARACVCVYVFAAFECPQQG